MRKLETLATNHTAGEWYTDRIAVDGDFVIFCKGHFAIARIIKLGISKDEHEANARLIASAPDLLAACEAALCELSFRGSSYEAKEQVVKAIAKAKCGQVKL